MDVLPVHLVHGYSYWASVLYFYLHPMKLKNRVYNENLVARLGHDISNNFGWSTLWKMSVNVLECFSSWRSRLEVQETLHSMSALSLSCDDNIYSDFRIITKRFLKLSYFMIDLKYFNIITLSRTVVGSSAKHWLHWTILVCLQGTRIIVWDFVLRSQSQVWFLT